MRVLLQEFGSTLQMTIMDDGAGRSFSTVIDRSKLKWKELITGFMFEWVKGNLRQVFDAMPGPPPFILIPKDSSEELNTVAGRLGGILLETNDLLNEIPHHPAKATGKTLFVNVSDDLRYRSLFDKIRDDSWTYLNHQLGFDRRTRSWGKTEPPMPPKEFADYLVNGGYRRIVIVNNYLLDNYLGNCAIWLPALLRHLGIELVVIDNDPHDLATWGFLKRASLMNGAPRFSNLAVLNELADRCFENPSPIYGAIPQDYEGQDAQELHDDYVVTVLSNSRLELVNSVRPQIDFLKSVFPQENIFRDFQAWYLALRQIILTGDVPLAERLTKNHHLHMLFYAFLQEMKYWVIAGIKTSRSVEIYGDIGWGTLFPENYRGSLDNSQIEEIFSEGNRLYLLVNLSFNYLDASGPVYDMQRRRVPWLNMVPMVSSPAFAPLRDLEYDNNSQELNWRLENIRQLWVQPRVQQALFTYRKALASSVDNIRRVLNGEPQNGIFAEHLNEHRSLVNAAVGDYERRARDFIDFTSRELFGD